MFVVSNYKILWQSEILSLCVTNKFNISIVSASKKYSTNFSVIKMYDAQVKNSNCVQITAFILTQRLVHEVNTFYFSSSLSHFMKT